MIVSIHEALFVTVTILLAAWIGRDAAGRSMNVRSWVILTLLFSALIIPVYLYLKRPSIQAPMVID